MKILNRLPIYQNQEYASTPREPILVLPGQIVFRASLTPIEITEISEYEPTFPVIIDTGNNHNLAIRSSQLRSWARGYFEPIGLIKVNNVVVPLCSAKLWIHPNIRCSRELARTEPFSITFDDGIAVYPDDNNPARFPIMGMRAITGRELKLVVDGKNGYVDLKRGWW